ncbi:hypothetical protein ACIPRL_36585 [Streptomyces sp. NPDC090085]|uniref:hypothetical protein n=1 Tax=Streptomyces sp. NPDC090085 TaxID=3365943 RepID=UPI0037F1DB95
MLIKGFENTPIVPGEELLALPGFWAAYLMWLSQTEEYDTFLYPFGVDGADADAACDALGNEDHWPVFRIPFGDRHTAVVVGRNCPDDPETEYFITHPEWGRHGHLATVSGRQAGPGLSWDAAAVVGDALAQAGTPTALAPHLAVALLADHPLWEPAEWTLPAASPLSASQEPFLGILHCDGYMSPRCGTRLAQGITREQSNRLAHALGTWPA